MVDRFVLSVGWRWGLEQAEQRIRRDGDRFINAVQGSFLVPESDSPLATATVAAIYGLRDGQPLADLGIEGPPRVDIVVAFVRVYPEYGSEVAVRLASSAMWPAETDRYLTRSWQETEAPVLSTGV